MTVAVVTAVYGNAATLPALAQRLEAALRPRPWRLRFVVDASPDDSLAVAQGLAAREPRIGVTALPSNIGQHRALARGLGDEVDAEAWVCMDADLQDPPEAVPRLLERLAVGDVDAVFAGRRGRYEAPLRLVTGQWHRLVLSRLAGVPADAGAFVALGPTGRHAVVSMVSGGAPSVVAAVGVARRRTASVAVERAPRPVGSSAWTATARARQSGRTILWAAAARARASAGQPVATQRSTRMSE
jgi:hypothetical protein